MNSTEICPSSCLFDSSVRSNQTLWDTGGFCAPCAPIPSTVTPDMIDFLNLTTISLAVYKQVYCLNPPTDDTCPFGLCPNPDIAGILVRVSCKSQLEIYLSLVHPSILQGYITSLCFVFISHQYPEVTSEIIWPSLTYYLYLVVSSIIASVRGLLSIPHVVLVIFLVLSPTSFRMLEKLLLRELVQPPHKRRKASPWIPQSIYAVFLGAHIFFMYWAVFNYPAHLSCPQPSVVFTFVPAISWLCCLLVSCVGRFGVFLSERLSSPIISLAFQHVEYIPCGIWIFSIEYFLVRTYLSNDNRFTPSVGQLLPVFSCVSTVWTVCKYLIEDWKHRRGPEIHSPLPFGSTHYDELPGLSALSWCFSFFRLGPYFGVKDWLWMTKTRIARDWWKQRDRTFNPMEGR